MDIVKVNWSGGKDSTYAIIRHLQRNHKVKAVCYIPMLNDKIPLIQKEHYEFILRTANIFRNSGCDVLIVHGITYCEYVLHRSTRGKFKGRLFGFPCVGAGMCGFKRDSKLKALNSVDVGYYDYEDVGIAYDEFLRHSQLTNKKRSILVEDQITESFAKEMVRKRGLLSPTYLYSNRDGCVVCPNAKRSEIEKWLNDYPEAVTIMKNLQETVQRERPDCFPLRGYNNVV